MNQAFTLSVYILKGAEESIDGCHRPMDISALTAGPRLQGFGPLKVDRIDGKIPKKSREGFYRFVPDFLAFAQLAVEHMTYTDTIAVSGQTLLITSRRVAPSALVDVMPFYGIACDNWRRA